MPSINPVRNNGIESEEDIPEKYREEVKRRMRETTNDTEFRATSITSGKRGEPISDVDTIKSIFSDSQNWYLGHGTGGNGDETVIESILKIGLKCKNSEESLMYDDNLRNLDSPTVNLGQGNASLFEYSQENLNHWAHKESKQIAIISLPERYVLDKHFSMFMDPYEAFYVGSEEQGFFTRPEFIMGVYDANTRSFIPNENYYQNLKQEQQNQLFEDIKKNYMKSFVKQSDVSPNEVRERLPFNESELEELNIEWYQKQLERLQYEKEKGKNTITLDDIRKAIDERVATLDDNAWPPEEEWE